MTSLKHLKKTSLSSLMRAFNFHFYIQQSSPNESLSRINCSCVCKRNYIYSLTEFMILRGKNCKIRAPCSVAVVRDYRRHCRVSLLLQTLLPYLSLIKNSTLNIFNPHSSSALNKSAPVIQGH